MATTPGASSELPGRLLDNLVSYLHQLYQVSGDRAVLHEAVELQRAALEATPTTSAKRPQRLNNLASYLSQLYQVSGDRAVLDEAVRLQRQAVDATPWTSTERSACLTNLAGRLADLYAATAMPGSWTKPSKSNAKPSLPLR